MTRHWRDVEPGDSEYAELVLGVVFVWGFADTASTLTAAAAVGAHHELNPLVRGLIADPVALIAVKLAAGFVVASLALAGERFVRTVPWWRTFMAALIGVGVGVTAINALVALSPVYDAVVQSAFAPVAAGVS